MSESGKPKERLERDEATLVRCVRVNQREQKHV